MEQFINAMQVVLGVVLVFGGAHTFLSSPRTGGFLMGGLIGAMLAKLLVAAPAEWASFMPLVGFLIGGLIGALVAGGLRVILMVITGAALGVLIGLVLGYIINQQGITEMLFRGVFKIESINALQAMLMLIFGLTFGALAVRFDEFMGMVSTAVIGSLLVVSAASPLASPYLALFTDLIFLIFLWAGLALFGTIWQYLNREQ